MADYEEIAYAVETIRAAHLFYEYGKLDRRIPKMICSRSIMIFWLRLQTTWTKNLMMTTK